MKKLVLIGLGVLAASAAMAQYRVMTEASTTSPPGQQSMMHSYNTHGNVLTNTANGFAWNQWGWIPEYQTAGIAYDGKYRVFGEKDTSSTSGPESVIYTYDTYYDLINGNYSGWSNTQLNWSSEFRTVAFEYDGLYRVMGERWSGGSAGDESFVYTYNTMEDLLANQWAYSQNTQLDWNAGFRTAGLAFENGKYRLMGESNTHNSAGFESIVYTYDSWSQFIANNWSTWSWTQRDVDPAFNTRGFTYEPVPEPVTLAALGLGVAAMIRKRKSR